MFVSPFDIADQIPLEGTYSTRMPDFVVSELPSQRPNEAPDLRVSNLRKRFATPGVWMATLL